MAKLKDLTLEDEVGGSTAIDDSAPAADKTYSSDKIEQLAMRGVAVFISATEPTEMQVNDIWIKI